MTHRSGLFVGSSAQPDAAERAAAQPCGEGARAPLLFARSLFLPADLGGNRYPYEVVTRLGARGHPVTVATPRLHGQFPRLPNVRYRHYPVSRRHPALTHATNLVSGALALRPERGRHPVALAGSYDVALALDWAGLLARTPLVFLFHSEYYSEWVQALGRGPAARVRRAILGYMAVVERRVFARSARLVAVSEFSARQIRERAPGTREKIRVVPTGVDTSFFRPPDDCAAAKRAIGQPPDGLLILGVGRLVGVKRFDRLIQGFARARMEGVEGRLVIAGDGPERPGLDRLVRELGVGDAVELAGYCDPPRLRSLMQAADLQVCSSAFENASLAILEAFASGVPVLGTPGGGTPELVGVVDGSLVLSDDSAAAIAGGLKRLSADRARLRQLGVRARALAAERYDWERVVDRLESVCGEVSPSWV